MKIIDAHTHVFEPGAKNPFNRPASPDDLIKVMDEHGVEASIVIPLPNWASNQYIQEQCKRYPKRLFGLHTPDFRAPEGLLPSIEAAFRAGAPRGIKIHPRLQGVTVETPEVRSVVRWAGAHSVPIVFDVFPFGAQLNDPAIHPMAYHRVAQDFPETTIVLAHAGGYRVMDAFMVAKANPNIVLDISFTLVYFKDTSIDRDLSFVCKRLPPGRLMYGSDFPSQGFGEYLSTSRTLLKELSDEQRGALFSHTAARLFRMGE